MRSMIFVVAATLVAASTASSTISGPIDSGGHHRNEHDILLNPTTNALVVPSWSDDFDAYAPGGLIGLGGWEGWDGNSAFDALVTSSEAQSQPHSTEVLSTSDVVYRFTDVSSGHWVLSAWSYVPASASGQQYLILMNTYAPGGPYNWSLQVLFDSDIDELQDADSDAALPLIHDQWVELRVDIDLDTDAQSVYYDGQLLLTDSWTNHVGNPGPGALAIAALDLYSPGGSSIYWDDFLFGQASPPVEAFGFMHFAIGDAHLSTDADSLVIGNLGGPGVDGVSIDVAGRMSAGDLFYVDLALPPNHGYPAVIHTDAFGVVDGAPNQPVCALTLGFAAPDTFTVRVDMSASSPVSMDALILYDGVVVDVINVPTGIVYGNGYSSWGNIHGPIRFGFDEDWTGESSIYIKNPWGQIGGGTIDFRNEAGDYLFGLPEGPWAVDFIAVNPQAHLDELRRVDVTTNDMPEFKITSEAIGPAPQPTTGLDEPGQDFTQARLKIVARPNPFNPQTEITFANPMEQTVSLAVYSVGGAEVRRLYQGTLRAGEQRMSWDGRDASGAPVPSGTYLLRLRAGDRTGTSKVLLVQ